MTREEAMRMPKDKLLAMIKADYEAHFPHLKQIDLIYEDGNKSAIGNPACVEAAKKAILAELDKQIADLNGSDIVEVITYGKREKMKRNEAIAKFREYMAGSEGSERDRYVNVYLDLTAGKKVCKDEH